MGDNSDDEVVEVSRDEFIHKLDEDICMQEQNSINIKEGLGEPSNVKQHDVYFTSKGVIAEGSPSVTKEVKKNVSSVGTSKSKKRLPGKKSGKHNIPEDPEFCNFTRRGEYRLRLPALASKRAGFTKKLHTLKFENLQGQVSIYEVKPEKNGSASRYSVINWPIFMAENNLNDGVMLDFTYVTSKKTVILKNVRSV
ncbi:putative transcription factor B3-Domain family [Helianthus annuus]|uniref:Transcription factor B3-Domain family n=1 Tax=Helianthus annuus TaxID=4232 RepID=A0A9K3H2J9_HELAN|nr:putative transcription factor B3-Domain family [Helianthus annuus]KAJ0451676.1 putative transcription factor B3-Domain family [Helianthus annuus]KAJ0456313.1 putative transcription factor B3-Domain family [Helianthus annuus]KAJ0473561.1 putative transcription factor B3-Domain family [Helianthus annuus]KAJ0649140.1 putative transcription factor B3-Domain family [Helianthus annuus]